MDKIGFIKGEKDKKVKIRPVCNSFTNANNGYCKYYSQGIGVF